MPSIIETDDPPALKSAKGTEDSKSSANNFVSQNQTDIISFHLSSCQAIVQAGDNKSLTQLLVWVYLSIMFSIVVISAIVISFDPSTVEVIQIAEVFTVKTVHACPNFQVSCPTFECQIRRFGNNLQRFAPNVPTFRQNVRANLSNFIQDLFWHVTFSNEDFKMAEDGAATLAIVKI